MGYTISAAGRIGQFPTFHDKEDAQRVRAHWAKRNKGVSYRVVADPGEPEPPKGQVFEWLPPGSLAPDHTMPLHDLRA